MAQTQYADRAAAATFSSWRPLARTSYRVSAVIAVVIAVAVLDHVLNTTPSRGLAIRDAMVAAAAKLGSQPASVKGGALRSVLAPYFRNFDSQIDVSHFPAEVDVTLRGLGGVSCLEAKDVARRIEGLVVVQLEEQAAAAACGQRTR